MPPIPPCYISFLLPEGVWYRNMSLYWLRKCKKHTEQISNMHKYNCITLQVWQRTLHNISSLWVLITFCSTWYLHLAFSVDIQWFLFLILLLWLQKCLKVLKTNHDACTPTFLQKRKLFKGHGETGKTVFTLETIHNLDGLIEVI